jgi:hypothetical protein
LAFRGRSPSVTKSATHLLVFLVLKIWQFCIAGWDFLGVFWVSLKLGLSFIEIGGQFH